MFQRLLGASTVTLGLYLYLALNGLLANSNVFTESSTPLLRELVNSQQVDSFPKRANKQQPRENFTNVLLKF